jgi:hypothetical protein
MNRIMILAVVLCSALGACTTHKETVVERATPDTTVVVPEHHDTVVVPQRDTVVVPPQ